MWNKSKFEGEKSRRSYPRVMLEVVARLSNENRNLTCVVEDVSASGARLRLDGDAAQHLFGEGWVLNAAMLGRLPIDIRWRNVDHAGVTFEIGQDERAHLNRFVKALIRYGVTESAYQPGAQDRAPTVTPRRAPPDAETTMPPSAFRRT